MSPAELMTPAGVTLSQSTSPALTQAPVDAQIMIIDDDPIAIKVVRKYLQTAGYTKFVSTTDATSAVQTIAGSMPDVVLLDVIMPEISGIEVLRRIRTTPGMQHLPVIILTSSYDPEIKVQTLEAGATDFLSKPVDECELRLRVRNAVTVNEYYKQLGRYAHDLETQVRQRTAELHASREELILGLARAAEFRDDDTGRHVVRVGRYVQTIALEMGMDQQEAAVFGQAAQLHDVGKIGIPDAILCKNGLLEPAEYEVVQKHCNHAKRVFEVIQESDYRARQKHSELGARLLEISQSTIIKLASDIALTHHERWDGEGYPLGLAGSDIPLGGRMTAVADVFDALSSKRPYKPAFPLDKCFHIMSEERGKHFDPEVLDCFFRRREEIVQIQMDCADID